MIGQSSTLFEGHFLLFWGEIMRLCYFFLKFFVCAILYAFSNYGFKGTNIQTTIQFECFIFFLKSSFSPFEICRLAYIEALCLRKVFVTPNTFSESSSLFLERKKLRLPGKSFSIFVFLPQFWRSIHLPRKIYCCSVFISFILYLNC